MVRYALIFATLILSTTALAQETTRVVPGKYRVGFSSWLNFDFTRASRRDAAMGREIQINTWYPAKDGKGTPMRFAEYVYLVAQEDSVVIEVNRKVTMDQYLSELSHGGADVDSWRKFLSAAKPMNAVRDAKFLRGQYPVVLLIHGSAANHSFMGEFLASHGMIVISVPYKGYLQNAFDVNVIGMETEIRDHEFAFWVATRKLNTHPTKIGVVGASFGGQSAVGLAVRNKMVKGIVSLDGGIGSSFGPQLLNQFPYYNIEKVSMPVLHLYNPADTGGNLDWFNAAEYTDRYIVGFEHMDHSFFLAYGELDRVINNVIGPSKPKAGDNYAAVLSYTLTFLTEAFNSTSFNSDKLINLDKQLPWITPNIASKSYLKKKWSPVPPDELMKTLSTKGVEGVIALRARQKDVTAMPISDASYRALIVNRFNVPDYPGMKALAEKYQEDFPASAVARYLRGRALMMSGDVEGSKIFFQQCLDLLDADGSLSSADKAVYKSRCEGFLKQ